MDQRNVVLAFLVFVIITFGGMVLYDLKTKNKLGNLLNKDETNWKWDDRWPDGSTPVTPDNKNPDGQIPEKEGFIAGSYSEAIKLSGDLGRPVLVMFTSESCKWCKKMKQEVMPEPRVKLVCSNYVLVYVDADRNRAQVNKFGVRDLPTYVITNCKEEKLKSDRGFKDANAFSQWLNNPNLFNQPKQDAPRRRDNPPDVEGPPNTDPDSPNRPNRRLPRPNQPPMQPGGA